MHLHHFADEEVVLLYPPVIGEAPDSRTAFRDLRRMDVHHRLGRLPEPLELVDVGDRRMDAGEVAGRWAWPAFPGGNAPIA